MFSRLCRLMCGRSVTFRTRRMLSRLCRLMCGRSVTFRTRWMLSRLCRLMCGRSMTFRERRIFYRGLRPRAVNHRERTAGCRSLNPTHAGIARQTNASFRKVEDLPHIGRRSREENPGKISSIGRRSREENPGKVPSIGRRSHEENPGEVLNTGGLKHTAEISYRSATKRLMVALTT